MSSSTLLLYISFCGKSNTDLEVVVLLSCVVVRLFLDFERLVAESMLIMKIQVNTKNALVGSMFPSKISNNIPIDPSPSSLRLLCPLLCNSVTVIVRPGVCVIITRRLHWIDRDQINPYITATHAYIFSASQSESNAIKCCKFSKFEVDVTM